MLPLCLNTLFILTVGAHAARVGRGAQFVLCTTHVRLIRTVGSTLRTAVETLTLRGRLGEVVTVRADGNYFESAELGNSLHTIP